LFSQASNFFTSPEFLGTVAKCAFEIDFSNLKEIFSKIFEGM
jgi:hypothetical protein